ncbi:MAG: hypothetical protein ACK4OM_01420 [Alphaproteobacteria bacterium]
MPSKIEFTKDEQDFINNLKDYMKSFNTFAINDTAQDTEDKFSIDYPNKFELYVRETNIPVLSIILNEVQENPLYNNLADLIFKNTLKDKHGVRSLSLLLTHYDLDDRHLKEALTDFFENAIINNLTEAVQICLPYIEHKIHDESEHREFIDRSLETAVQYGSLNIVSLLFENANKAQIILAFEKSALFNQTEIVKFIVNHPKFQEISKETKARVLKCAEEKGDIQVARIINDSIYPNRSVDYISAAITFGALIQEIAKPFWNSLAFVMKPGVKLYEKLADSFINYFPPALETQTIAKTFIRTSAPFIIGIATLKSFVSFTQEYNESKDIKNSFFKAAYEFGKVIMQGGIATAGAVAGMQATAAIATTIAGAAGIVSPAVLVAAVALPVTYCASQANLRASSYVAKNIFENASYTANEAKKTFGPFTQMLKDSVYNKLGWEK